MRCWSFLFIVIPLTEWVNFVQTVKPSILYNGEESFLNTNGPVFHIELDYHKRDGSLLIGTNKHLVSTDGLQKAKLASFLVTSFTQKNATHVFVVDHYRHCLKVFNRETDQLTTFAGTCVTSGYAEGGVGKGRLNRPWGVVVDARNPNRLLVTDELNRALRFVDLHNGHLGTESRDGFFHPKSLLFAGNELLVTNYNNILKVSWSNGRVNSVQLTGTKKQGDRLGAFNQASFGAIMKLEKFSNNKYLIADYGNRKLKLLDMEKRTVGAVCFKDQTIECNFPDNPLSILSMSETLYVGTKTEIHKLTESKENKRLVFKGKYDVRCHMIDYTNYRRVAIESTLAMRRAQLQAICEKQCTLSLMIQPYYTCRDDQLTVYWPTDQFYPPNTQEVPKEMAERLKMRLRFSEPLKTFKFSLMLL